MKQQLIEQISSEQSRHRQFIETSFPSIFSREDVLKMVDEFAQDVLTIVMEMEEEKSSRSMSLEDIQDLAEKLTYAINKKVENLDSEEVVDYGSACFSINYSNTIEIDSIDYMSDSVTEAVDIAVDEVLHDYFSAEEPEENEIVNETPYATEQ